MQLNKYLSKSAIEQLDSYSASYQIEKPFSYIFTDNFLNDEFAKLAAENFPSLDSGFWFQYDNPIEKKPEDGALEEFRKKRSEVFGVY